MKWTSTLILLITFICSSSAQTRNEKFDNIILSYNGDSTLLIQKYEIDLKKEKIYYITPIMNYLDVKGEKYRTRVKMKKGDWDRIVLLVNKIYSLNLDKNKKEQELKVTYSLELSKGGKLIKEYYFYSEKGSTELKNMFEILRKNAR
ncbi:hypothetical protein ACE01N_20100 [Saccharicrinis sp. FJH2]|uniref:hypothetical protein n=1 Tax=Saccharicrinis sp. FJH65 TaxID=3344659 RepID=UPI0035F2EE85